MDLFWRANPMEQKIWSGLRSMVLAQDRLELGRKWYEDWGGDWRVEIEEERKMLIHNDNDFQFAISII